MGNLLTSKKYNMTSEKASKINLLDIPTKLQAQKQLQSNHDFHLTKPAISHKSSRSISNDKGTNPKVKNNAVGKNGKKKSDINGEDSTKIH